MARCCHDNLELAGVNEIPERNSSLSHSAASHNTPHWPPVHEPEPIKKSPKWRRPDAAGTALRVKIGLISGLIWFAVLILCVLSFVVTAFFANTQHTIMLTDMPDLASANEVMVALFFSLVVGLGTGWGIGGKGGQAVFLSLGSAGMLFMFLLVPMIVTSHQIAQAWTFSGNTTHSVQSFRINGVYSYQSKGGWRWEADINPLHCPSCMPTIAIDQPAYQFIVDHGGTPRFTASTQVPTNLCMTFDTQRAGRSERIILADSALRGIGDIKACPPGAR